MTRGENVFRKWIVTCILYILRGPEYKQNKNSTGCWKIVKVLKNRGDMDLESICQAKGQAVKI